MTTERSLRHLRRPPAVLASVATFALSSLLVMPVRADLGQCYLLKNGNELFAAGSNWHPCGIVNSVDPYISCCKTGDICVGNKFCHVPTGPEGPGYSGYYLGGCTDPTYKAESCAIHCGRGSLSEAVYDAATGEWACCSTGDVSHCRVPTDETWVAPAPSLLTGDIKVPVVTSVTNPSSTTATVATTTSTPSDTSASLSVIAYAGIGIGAGAGALAIGGVVLYVFLHYRKRRNSRYIKTVDGSTAFKPESYTLSAPLSDTLGGRTGYSALPPHESAQSRSAQVSDTVNPAQEVAARPDPSRPVLPFRVESNLDHEESRTTNELDTHVRAPQELGTWEYFRARLT